MDLTMAAQWADLLELVRGSHSARSKAQLKDRSKETRLGRPSGQQKDLLMARHSEPK